MKINFVSHASVIVYTTDSVIWSDPWLTGKAFNNSWSLFPEACFEQNLLKIITHIWISHEHPDHFSIPTLNSLPNDFKQNVIILFQENNSDKVPLALKKFGYKNIIRLPHAKFVQITQNTCVWCYEVGQMDSILAIKNNEQVILNLNDAELTSYDCRHIKKNLNNIDVILNQYSMAGYNGYMKYDHYLPIMARSILDKVYHIHTNLGANLQSKKRLSLQK